MALPVRLTLAILSLAAVSANASARDEAGRYLTTEAFLDGAFAGTAPAANTLWVKDDLRDSIEAVLGHSFASLRVRYWYDGETSAWILDEIGKELPITIGVSVSDGAIDAVQILEFRETRGWEVRYPFFTDQFHGVGLDENGRLDRRVDGITGATLSVRAVRRIARLALILHEQISDKTKR